ncbi:hypothetical protein [Flavihumibacter sp. CACIAM 22H1]|uniref:DUF5018-related domain-containing protein n=1 Tax=Flavihumibacter sp. CACIAM 22H1 TaxID=1812911 RepID=UPI0007A7E9AD|nr:hypothetical protein [Flavihumibacter sp. CACIAM 22H1]KYP15363.1 MAG: hypothetical protein A1D16_16400 [Flavihumibacter sp. CACIAM 22H1]
MKRLYSVVLAILVLSMSSCLKSGLDDNLPKFKDAFITDVFMEYRFEDPTASSGGSPVVRIVNLNVSAKQFKRLEDTPGAATDSAIFDVQVPGASGSFTAAERDKVNLTNLVFMSNISTAATMTAMEGAPRPGIPGDFSQPRKYQVKAADGSVRVWTVRINQLIK